MSERIGVLGGAFDPIHIGHLILGQSARDELKLDRVFFVPTFAPAAAHKAITTSFGHRVAMLRLATADNEGFHVSEIEESLPTPTYTVNTLQSLHASRPNAELFFLMGADSLAQVDTWHQPEKLVALARLAVAPRSGYPLTARFPFARIDMPLIEVSATVLRQRTQEGFSLRYLVPDPVIAYIDENRLYREV